MNDWNWGLIFGLLSAALAVGMMILGVRNWRGPLAGSVLAEGGAMFSLGLCAVFLSIAPSVWLRDVVVAFLLLNWIVFSFLGFRLWRYARRVAPEKPTDDRVSSSELD